MSENGIMREQNCKWMLGKAAVRFVLPNWMESAMGSVRIQPHTQCLIQTIPLQPGVIHSSKLEDGAGPATEAVNNG